MSEAAAIQSAPSPEANGTGVSVVPSLEERSAAAFGMAGSAGDTSGSPPAPDGASPAVSAEPDANAKARAERRAALEKLRAEERSRVDTMAAIRERDELRRKLSEYEARSKESDGRIDPKALTKEQFFALAAQNPDLTPAELGEWLRERMANPEAVAVHAAKKAVDPEIAALKKQIAEQQEAFNRLVQSQQSAQEEAVERQAAEQFFSFTRENAATSPYSARFLEKHGPEEFYKLAQSVARQVPPHAGAQAILDEIEENLTHLGAIYTADTANQQRRQATPTQPNPAAAKAPMHVTNTLAQQRSSVVDEEQDWAQLPFEERSARLFR